MWIIKFIISLILSILFGALIGYVNYANTTINHLKKENKSLSKTIEKTKNELGDVIEDMKSTISEWDAEYYEDLKNFKKLIKLYGKEIDYIPYYHTMSKSVDEYFVDVKEDFYIPAIHIVYHNGCLKAHYDELSDEEKEEFGE